MLEAVENDRLLCLLHLEDQHITANVGPAMVFQNITERLVVVGVSQDFFHFAVQAGKNHRVFFNRFYMFGKARGGKRNIFTYCEFS